MILTEGNCFPFFAENWAWVSCIGDVVSLRSDEYNIGGASNSWSNEFLFGLWYVFRGVFDLSELILSFNWLYEFIDAHECLIQSFYVILFLIWLVFSQLLDEDIADILADFRAYMSRVVPPWPSNTAKSELLLPMSSSWMAASSMVLRQPILVNLNLAFLLRWKIVCCFRQYWYFWFCWVRKGIHPLLINLEII